MRKRALIAVMLMATSPASAQVATSPNQQGLLPGQTGELASTQAATQAPTTGVFCAEEMTATFCNVPTGPNTGGYGTGGGPSATGGGAASGLGEGSAGGIASNTSASASGLCKRHPDWPDFESPFCADVTLPGAAGRVTAADCEAGSAVAGGAVTLPGRRWLVRRRCAGAAGRVTAVDCEAGPAGRRSRAAAT